jgi:hypothetical protein
VPRGHLTLKLYFSYEFRAEKQKSTSCTETFQLISSWHLSNIFVLIHAMVIFFYMIGILDHHNVHLKIWMELSLMQERF